MAKNNDLITRYKTLYNKINQIVPEVYAGIALALHRNYGWDYEQINELFEGSQRIWEDCNEKNVNMVQMCADETGIELRSK